MAPRPHKDKVVIMRHGKPVGVLIGFQSENDWLEYRLENDPRFLKHIASARASLRDGKVMRIEDVPD
jgi:PHD/YefM family antitoxin component YafN of YafNO toxin-antitoxin module